MAINCFNHLYLVQVSLSLSSLYLSRYAWSINVKIHNIIYFVSFKMYLSMAEFIFFCLFVFPPPPSVWALLDPPLSSLLTTSSFLSVSGLSISLIHVMIYRKLTVVLGHLHIIWWMCKESSRNLLYSFAAADMKWRHPSQELNKQDIWWTKWQLGYFIGTGRWDKLTFIQEWMGYFSWCTSL